MRRAQPLLAFAQGHFHLFQFSDIESEAPRIDELTLTEIHVRADQHVLDRAVLGFEPRFVLVEFFALRQAGQNVVDGARVGMEFSDVAADIFLA
jgi:hypothetical protein